MRLPLAFSLIVSALPAFGVGTSSIETGGTNDDFRITASTHILFSSANPITDGQDTTKTLLNETKLQSEYGRFQLGADFSNRFVPQGQASTDPARPLAFEKATGQFQSDEWQVQIGDTHQELGRGIALSLYRDDNFGLDNTLQGASIRFNPKGFDGNIFAGRVNSLRNAVALNPQVNPVLTRDLWLGGGSVKAMVAADTSLEGHTVVAQEKNFDTTKPNANWRTYGGSFQMDGVLDLIDVYVESNVLTLGNAASSTTDNGYGNFASVTYSAQPWKLKVEAKDYRHFAFTDFNRPPTLEDDSVLTLNTSDVSAGRFTVERRLGDNPNNLVHASFLYGWDGSDFTQVNHAVIGGKLEGPGRTHFEWKGGYRWMPNQQTLVHGLLKGKIRTGKGQALELAYRKLYLNDNLSTVPALDDRNYVDLTYTFSERWGAALGYEYVPTNNDSLGQHFVNVGGTMKLGPLSARGFVGTTSGGFLCSGGVCRQIPPYSGAYFDGTYVF